MAYCLIGSMWESVGECVGVFDGKQSGLGFVGAVECEFVSNNDGIGVGGGDGP